MAINSRDKGIRGELEFAKWLHKNLNLDKVPDRDLEQARKGGADILEVKPFVFEVKRQEKLLLNLWWQQVEKSVATKNSIPVVAYRQNYQPWRFLISAKMIGLDCGYIQIESGVFIEWVLNTMDSYEKHVE